MSDRRLSAEWGASTPVRSITLGRHMPTRCTCDKDEEEIICVGDRYVTAYVGLQTCLTVFLQHPHKARSYETDP